MKINMISDENKRNVSQINQYSGMYKKIMDKFSSGHYELKDYPCPICKTNKFDDITDSDRYFLPSRYGICKGCGLFQIYGRMSEENYEEFYDSGEYKCLCMDNLNLVTHHYYEYSIMSGYVLSHLKGMGYDIKNIKVIEIGCGSGGILLKFQEEGACVQGYDLCREYVDFGKKFLPSLFVSNVFSEKNQDLSKWDIVLLSHVLEHFFYPDKFLEQLSERVGNAKVLILVPLLDNAIKYQIGKGIAPFLNISHIWYFSFESLKNLMGNAGFSMESYRVQGSAIETMWVRKKKDLKIVNCFEGALHSIKAAEENKSRLDSMQEQKRISDREFQNRMNTELKDILKNGFIENKIIRCENGKTTE